MSHNSGPMLRTQVVGETIGPMEDTAEDDEFTRKALDMSEQTCFLHAFCRTDLMARVKFTELAPAA